VVVCDSGVAIPAGCGARNILGVAVTFENVAIGAECEIVEGVGELADSSAGAGNDASFTEFAAGYISVPGERRPGLSPKADGFSGLDSDAVPMAESDAEVFDFAESEERFVWIVESPELGY
jgi:hypothetical protein